MSQENGRKAQSETPSSSHELRCGIDYDSSFSEPSTNSSSSRQPSPTPQRAAAPRSWSKRSKIPGKIFLRKSSTPKKESTLPRFSVSGLTSSLPIRQLTEEFIKTSMSSTRSDKQSPWCLSTCDEPRATVKRISIASATERFIKAGMSSTKSEEQSGWSLSTSDESQATVEGIQLIELADSTKLSSALRTKRLLVESTAAKRLQTSSSQRKLSSTRELSETSSEEEEPWRRPSTLPLKTVANAVQKTELAQSSCQHPSSSAGRQQSSRPGSSGRRSPVTPSAAKCVADVLSTVVDKLRDFHQQPGDEKTPSRHERFRDGKYKMFFYEKEGVQTDCKLKQFLDRMKETILAEAQTTDEAVRSPIPVSAGHRRNPLTSEGFEVEMYYVTTNRRYTRETQMPTKDDEEGDDKLMCCLSVSIPKCSDWKVAKFACSSDSSEDVDSSWTFTQNTPVQSDADAPSPQRTFFDRYS